MYTRNAGVLCNASVLLAVVLLALGFVAIGNNGWLQLLLASVTVPTVARTSLVLVRRRDDEQPLDLPQALGVLLTSAALTVMLGTWLILVIALTATLKSSDEGRLVVIPILLVGLVVWLALLWKSRWSTDVSPHKTRKLDWRRPWPIRFTTRGILVAVALVALSLWPIHLLRMQPIYRAFASNELLLSDLCMFESQLMAARAKQCRNRAAVGAEWELDDDVTKGLKICPYPSDRPGRSWLEQAEVWSRAAERCRSGAERHRARSESF